MSEEERKVSARCRVCGGQLTLTEFRACEGAGHFCRKHLPVETGPVKRSSSSPRRKSGRGGRRVSESGHVEYSCRAQFAGSGVIRAGKLTSDHPSCAPGEAVFIYKGVNYSPGEIAVLFIRNSEGRQLAENAGFECHE